MGANSPSVVGWDIGGVNIKAVRLVGRAGEIVEHRAIVRPFEIWREPTRLGKVLARMGEELDAATATAMAVTMTAELSDVFRTKREGVLTILGAFRNTFPDADSYPLSLTGEFEKLADAQRHPLDFAANNWLASALCVARTHPDCILMDVGSTTADIIPIRAGRIVGKGRNDPDRLAWGELVYSGVLRTNPNTIVSRVPIGGRMCRVAAEWFCSMADVYLLLGLISPSAYTCPTADGRAKSRRSAHERLARLVCADAEILTEEQTMDLARYLFEKQVQQLVEALCQVLSALEKGHQDPVVVAGDGAFLATEAGRRLGMNVLDLTQQWGTEAGNAIPAQAAAHLLLEKISEDNA